MLERLHEHVVTELGHSSRTDTIFVVVAVIFNLIALGINSGFAERYDPNPGEDIILVVLIIMTILVNAIAITGLSVGRSTRQKLLSGLIAMYQDNQIDKYYDQSLVINYGKRYLLFAGVILVLAFTAISVPLVLRFF
ncbi:MAG: hypothetical protein ACYC3P_07915 [Bellilinea sp.]